MKNLLYILAVIAIGAGAVFSWQVKDKTNAQLDSLSELKGLTSNLSKSIDREEGNKSDADTAKNESRSAKDEVVAGLEAAEGKKGDLQKSLDQEGTRLEEQQARIAEVDKLMVILQNEIGQDVVIADVPGIVENLEEDKKAKTKKLDELENIHAQLTRKVADTKAEIARQTSKIAESKARVNGNTFRATVSSVNNEWGFLVIAAGEKSGLAGDSKLLLVRNGRLLGKVLISSLEANQAIAEIAPGSMATGVRPQPGDSVILADTAAN
ncbi:hypothetical protein N9821_01855 [Akkermansiaceae bacterium]|nr:hypothetical protein [Akkermansiaceae bacterium]MDB4570552.1 hypothetical protein [Akkermansiaceae bacterium]